MKLIANIVMGIILGSIAAMLFNTNVKATETTPTPFQEIYIDNIPVDKFTDPNNGTTCYMIYSKAISCVK